MESSNEKIISELKATNNDVKEYIESLSSIEIKALTIAVRELESSFSIEKSIGFINFQKNLFNTIKHKNN
jgi:hypothetical protein